MDARDPEGRLRWWERGAAVHVRVYRVMQGSCNVGPGEPSAFLALELWHFGLC